MASDAAIASRATGCNHYKHFCDAFDLRPPFPDDADENSRRLDLFAFWLYRRSFRAATINTYIASVRFLMRVLPVPVHDHTGRLRIVARLAASEDVRPTMESAPVTLGMMRALATLTAAGAVSSHIHAACVFAFVFFMRVSEYAASGSDWESKILRARDVESRDNRVYLTFRRRKNNPLHYPHRFCRNAASDPAFDPVRVWNAHVAALPFALTPDMPAFMDASGRPVHAADISSALSLAASAVGLTARYTPHSLRIGAATAAFRMGMPEARIMQQGMWKTAEGFRRYTRGFPEDAADCTDDLFIFADHSIPVHPHS